MKKAIMMCVALMTMISAHGLTGTANGYTWGFTLHDDGTAGLTSCSPSPVGMLEIPSSLSYEYFGNMHKVNVSSIGDDHTALNFDNNSKLTGVTIPGCIKSINSFYHCDNLESVIFADGIEIITAFEYCPKLKSIEFPPSVRFIGSGAFSGCPLTNLVVNSGCYIRGGAFDSCELKSIRLADNIVFSYGVYLNVSNDELIDFESIPGITLIDGYAIPCSTNNVSIDWDWPEVLDLTSARGLGFGGHGNGNTETKTIILPENMQNIPPCAFQGISNLKTVIFGKNSQLRHVYQNAFEECETLKSLEFPQGVEIVDYLAFPLSGIDKVTFPASLKTLSLNAFFGCNIRTIVFNGDAPELVFDWGEYREERWFFYDRPRRDDFAVEDPDCVVYVHKGSNGWGVSIPGTWHGLRIEYIEDDVLPEASDETAVAEALATFIDGSIAQNITTVGQYDRLRMWVQSVKLPTGETGGLQAAKASSHAWLSFALGSDRLIEREVTSDDVRIVSFGAADGGGSARGRQASFAVEVAIDGVGIGSSGAVALDGLRESLNKVLGVEGAHSLASGAFSPDGVEVTFDAPVDGRARFTVTPPADVYGAYFIRAKVLP